MATDISAIKFRLVMDVHGQSKMDEKDDLHDLYGDHMYTFNGGENTDSKPQNSAKSGRPIQNPRSSHLDLVSENCKLESIVEQYRLTNDRLKAQLLDITENNSKADILVETVKSFFQEMKGKGFIGASFDLRDEPNSDFIQLSSKICEAIEGKESNYLKECLKEFSTLLCTSRQKNMQLEKDLSAISKTMESTRKHQEILEFELKDLMKAAQDICNPDSDKPVNIYQLKMELRNRLKTLDRNTEVAKSNLGFRYRGFRFKDL